MEWTVLLFTLYFIKGITIGSEFNFLYWYKYGKKYTKWYFDRPEFPKDSGV
jgi:hypothetical protein